MRFKLGRQPSLLDPRRLRFSTFLGTNALPSTPKKFDWSEGTKLDQIYLNATLGDCTIAGVAHGQDVWAVGDGLPEVVFPDASLVKAYSECCGYDPTQTDEDGNNPTDDGGSELDVLKYMRKTGLLGPDGKPYTIKAFTSINPVHTQNWNCANWLFGGTYLGIVVSAFMKEWMQQDPMPDWVWPKKMSKAGLKPIGGHAIWQIAYDTEADENDALGGKVSTWGMKVKSSRRFLDMVTQEVWGVIGWKTIPAALQHYNMQALEQFLTSLEA